MTKTERLEAYRMRLEGKTMVEIAKKFGVSRQYLYSTMPCSGKAVSGCIYPHINEWMLDNDCGCSELADRVKVSYSSLMDFIRGVTQARKNVIDRLLDVTGMTYEYAFATEVSNGAEV